MTKNSILVKQLDLSACKLQQFGSGLIKAFFHVIKRQPGNEDLVCKIFRELLMSYLLLKKKEKSFMLVCLPDINWTTSIDKSIFLGRSSLIMISLQILARELTLIEKDFIPFWMPHSTELSKKLWFPIKTDYVDSELNLSTGLLPEEEENSLFWSSNKLNPQNKNLRKTLCPLSQCLTVDKWEEDDIRLKTLKIKMYPTLEQRAILSKWRNTHRYVYNKTLEYSNKNKEYNFQNLRNVLVSYNTEKGVNPNIQLWELETPKDIRANAIDDVVSSLKGNFTKLNKKSINSFNIRFRRRKNKSYSFGIPKTAFKIVNNSLNVYTTFFNKAKINPNIKLGKRTSKNISINHDSKIHYKHGQYFLLIPMPITCKYKYKNKEANDIIALDPGVRTFQTGYSMREIVSFRRDPELINKLKTKIAILQTNRKFKKIQKYHNKINNIVDDLHWRTIGYLTKNYYNVLLPHFESQEMLGSLTKKTRYNINSLKHYQFKQRLIYKSNHTNTKIFLVNEAYTTKTCGRCGIINNNVGGSKIFECNSCNLKIDRDFNGARNILLKHLNSGAFIPI